MIAARTYSSFLSFLGVGVLVEIQVREALNHFELRHFLIGMRSLCRNTMSCRGFILNWSIV